MNIKKTVMITGGNKGIGLALTKKFLESGYYVIIIARDFKSFKYNDHKKVRTIPFDLTAVSKIPSLISTLPGIDILINNAGTLLALPYTDYPQEKTDEILKLNIEAPVALIREVSAKMKKKGSGRIVNNASIAGQIGHPDIWYGITKAGMINMTKSFAKILGPDGIIINAVAPGPAETDMLDVIPEQRKKDIKKAVYTGRFAYADEIAETIFWLATESPEYINGTCIDINNGSFPR